MLRPLALLGLLLTLGYCSNPVQDQVIALSPSQNLRLAADEHIETLQSEDLQFFEQHFHPRSSTIQLPVYRVIRHPAYTLFVALPLQTSLAQWKDRLSRTAEQMALEQEETAEHILGFWTADSLYLAQYARHADMRVQWVLCGASPDSALLRNLLHPDSLALRFQP